MLGLIGDRFLKRFFRNRSHRHKAKPAGEEKSSPVNEEKLPSAEKPVESGCPLSEALSKKDGTLEIKTGEINQIQDTHE